MGFVEITASSPTNKDLEPYLSPTEFFDFNSSTIQELLNTIDLDGLNETEKAVKLFYFVRDLIRYSIKPVNLDPVTYTASHIAQQNSSFCIPKAILLGTLARAVGIPSRLHLVDFANHRLAPELMGIWGTNVMAAHCYSELYLDGEWRKATPALDKGTCDKHGFRTVEFDGIHDGLLHQTDIKGNPHAEYVKDRGTFPDIDLALIKQIWDDLYGSSDRTTSNMANVEIDNLTFK